MNEEFLLACGHNDKEKVKFFIESGVDINVQDEICRNALHLGIKFFQIFHIIIFKTS